MLNSIHFGFEAIQSIPCRFYFSLYNFDFARYTYKLNFQGGFDMKPRRAVLSRRVE